MLVRGKLTVLNGRPQKGTQMYTINNTGHKILKNNKKVWNLRKANKALVFKG
jgi:hypothetical protein